MKLTNIVENVLLLFLFLPFATTNAQLTVINSTNPPYNPTYLIEDVFLGAGVDVLNVSYSGSSQAIGYFNGVNSNIGLNEGLLMTTGSADLAVGPNNSPSSGAINFSGSDPDLVTIAGTIINDATVFEIDFIPFENTLSFRYVFASEEYDEYVCSGFNDVFGFFISGPGFNGPYSGGAENIALIPGTTIPVAIDNINNGGGLCGPTNVTYYRNNLAGTSVEYDAFTTVLEATVSVVPCSQYSIKLAIGDALDFSYDSGVFLEANSFGTEVINVEIISPSNDSSAIEGCSAATILVTLPSPSLIGTTVPLNIGGTATNGVDYQTIPNSLFIPAGQSSVSFPITPIVDNIVEGTETITFQVPISSCAQKTVTAYIKDNLPPPFLTCNALSSSIVFSWQPIPNVVYYEVNVGNTGWVSPNGTLQHTVNGTGGQTISIQVRGVGGTTSNPCFGSSTTISCTIPQSCSITSNIVTLNQSNCGGFCTGALEVSIVGGTPPFQYSWSNGQSTNPIFNLCGANTYSVTVVDANGCQASDTEFIPGISKLNVFANVDDASCNLSDGGIELNVSGGTPGYTYQWSNGANTSSITNLGTGTYSASITDDNGCCSIVAYELEMVDCCPESNNSCVEAFQGIIDICVELGNDPSLPLGTIDCDGDGVANLAECTDTTDPLDPCDYEDTSITLPVTADQTGCPLPCPDLTPITTVLPGNIAGNSPLEIAIKISEVAGVDTDGTTITVRVPSDPRLLFVWNIGLTQAAGIPVQNSDWNYLGNNGIFNVWTYNGNGQILTANSSSALGFQAFYDPQNTDGQTTFTGTVAPFSGGDCGFLNNTDSERLVYFR